MKLGQALAFPALPEGSSGLTVREYFAGLAMQGLASRKGDQNSAITAKQAVRMADDLIEELEKSA